MITNRGHKGQYYKTFLTQPEAVFLVMCDPSMNELSDLDRSMHRSPWA